MISCVVITAICSVALFFWIATFAA